MPTGVILYYGLDTIVPEGQWGERRLPRRRYEMDYSSVIYRLWTERAALTRKGGLNMITCFLMRFDIGTL